MIEGALNELSVVLTQKTTVAPLIAFVAGVLTSFTPCSLSSVPLVIGYMGNGTQASFKKAFLLSVVFALGMSITFTSLGVVASLFGRLIGATPIFYIVLGGLMIMMALQTVGIFQFIPSLYLQNRIKHRGYLGALLVGISGGFFSSPCSTPVLIVLLGSVAKQGDATWGVFLLFCYSVGHSVLVLICGTSIGFVAKIKSNGKYSQFSNISKYVMGILIFAAGLYMLYLGF